MPHVVCVSSGTAALHLACLRRRPRTRGRGDRAVRDVRGHRGGGALLRRRAGLLRRGGRRARRCSTRPTWSAVSPTRTKAVLAVHFCGYAADTDALRALCDEHGLMLIEDAAQAIRARVGAAGAMAGTAGDLGCLSFFSKKQLCVGEGGAVITSDEGLADQGALAALARHEQRHVGPPPRLLALLRRGRRGLQLPHGRAARGAGHVAAAAAGRRDRAPPRGGARAIASGWPAGRGRAGVRRRRRGAGIALRLPAAGGRPRGPRPRPRRAWRSAASRPPGTPRCTASADTRGRHRAARTPTSSPTATSACRCRPRSRTRISTTSPARSRRCSREGAGDGLRRLHRLPRARTPCARGR